MMLGYIHFFMLGPFIVIFLTVYVLGHLIAWGGAFLVMVLWRLWRIGRWAWMKAWLWSVDKRVPRAI